MSHILAIGAHIGDAEITAGLAVTKYAAAGHRATMLHMTAGEKGNPRVDHREYRKQRIAEAEAAAKKMGAADCIVLDHPDGPVAQPPAARGDGRHRHLRAPALGSIGRGVNMDVRQGQHTYCFATGDVGAFSARAD